MVVLNFLFLLSWFVLELCLSKIIFGHLLGEMSITPPTDIQFCSFIGFFTALSFLFYQELFFLFELYIGPFLEFGTSFGEKTGSELNSVLGTSESAQLISSGKSEDDVDEETAKLDEQKVAVRTKFPQYLFDVLAAPVNVCDRKLVRTLGEFSALMTLVYICDRTNAFSGLDKTKSLDLFWFIFFILVVVSLTTLKKNHVIPYGSTGHTGLLQRDQTEEWKGWMQILFLMYHYFNTNEIYNGIRIFIAAYVWMTGFGNFSYYYVKNNFSFMRFCQMMWRLNFLVLVACAVLSNDYMCYYICPLHTLWTLFIYVGLGVKKNMNSTKLGITIKFILLFASVYIIWDIEGVWDIVFTPFRYLLRYRNPHTYETNDMGEWHFRSALDRYVWIFGMFCAYNFPNFERFIYWVENQSVTKHIAIKGLLFTIVTVGFYFYVQGIYLLPKVEYNALHPFTSFIPIFIYIFYRNFTPRLRAQHNALFCWLGKITLETYILQYSVWLHTGHPNYQPKQILNVFKGYPLMNFAILSLGYIFLSYRAFHLTGDLRDALIVNDTNKLAWNLAKVLVSCLLLYVVGWSVRRVF